MDGQHNPWEEWLVLRCQAGDPGAFEDLIAVMEKPLRYYVLKLTRREEMVFDILQETWVRVLHGIRKLKDPWALRAWLYRVAHGLTMDALRREKARQQAEEQHCQELDETVEAPFPADEANALHWALDQLEPRQREVLVLHFLEDFSLVQIAQIVGCPEGTVKSRMHQAKKTMKVILTRGTCEQL